MAAETSEQRAAERAADTERRTNEIASMGSDVAISESGRIKADVSIGYLGPISTESEWTDALSADREVAIESASRGELLTYGELQVAAHRATGLKIGHSMYGRFCMELNQFDDHYYLISSIIVHTGTRDPGPGLIPYAQGVGIDKPIRTMQREVFEIFATEA